MNYLKTIFFNKYTLIAFNYVLPLVVAAAFIFMWFRFFSPDQGFWKEPLLVITNWGDEQNLKITDVEVLGASEVLDTQISLYLTEELRKINLNSLNLNLNQLKKGITFIPSVTDVELAIEKNGVLKVVVEERIPLVLWYDNEQYHLLDKDGFSLDTVTNRNTYYDFFVIAGKDAHKKVLEAMEILSVSEKINHHIRGLVWVGQRRWDVIMDRDRVIKLPEKEPLEAMRKLMVLDENENLLSRQISILDLRIPKTIYVRNYTNQ
ncbi:MAG: hypothetical protein F4203_04030 [Rhodobacteraceae bacterium]|nr:hypothetical protein [Paracoccaceae bacterium]